MPQYFRSDQARVQVAVAGVTLDTTSWDVMTGGDATAEDVNYLPGGMQPAVNLGGLPKRSDLTVERIWSDTLVGVFKQLDAAVGVAAATVTYTVLDASKNPVANASVTYTGILKSVARPGYASEPSSEAKLSLTIGLNGALT